MEWRYGMAEQLDTSKGWCCDGGTWIEHAHQGGKCCQPRGKRIEDLPPEARVGLAAPASLRSRTRRFAGGSEFFYEVGLA
jgi:hypothetical protein